MKNTKHDLENSQQIYAFLKERGKTRAWLNTLSSREKMIPRPIRKPKIGLKFSNEQISLNKKGRPIFTKQGSEVCYVAGTLEYLDKIIRLHDQDGKSYADIKTELKGDLDNLNLLIETTLLKEKRVREIGFYYNYKIASSILDKMNIYDGADKSGSFLKKILSDVEKSAKQYSFQHERVRTAILNNAVEDAEKERVSKEAIGQRLDFLYEVMESVIRHVLQYVKKTKGLSMALWFETAKEFEKESEG